MIDKEKYRPVLEKELEEVKKELSTIGIHNPENPSDWIAVPDGASTTEADPNDAADRVEEWDERRGAVAVLETRYNNLVRALKKMEGDTYGICEISGEEIEKERLDANPAARTSKAHMNEESNLSR